MKKKRFQKFVKALEKSEKAVITQENNRVSLAAAYAAIQVPQEMYWEEIKPLSGILPEVYEGYSGSRSKGGCFHKEDHQCSTTAIFRCDTAADPVGPTGFSKDLEANKGKKIEAKIYASDKHIYFLDKALLETLEDIAPGEWKGVSNKRPIYKDVDGIMAVLCPMAMRGEVEADFRDGIRKISDIASQRD